MADFNFKHGKTRTRLYDTWHHMKQRCYNSNDKNYKYYGGRGIAVCDEWKDDFISFHNWATNNGYKEGLTIDRIDVNGNYEPNNCRWFNRKQQARNRRNTRMITCKGETKPLAEWCEVLGLNYWTVISRLDRLNWSIEKSLFGGDVNA